MTGKTDEIVNYVQQQTDRLAQMIDGKRGTLVEPDIAPAHGRYRPRHLGRPEIGSKPAA